LLGRGEGRGDAAQAYFALGLYDSAQDQVNVIFPGNGLDRADHASWAVAGTLYPTYAAALSALIEFLLTF